MATNLAPADYNPLAERLADDYRAEVDRTAELVAAVNRAPAMVTAENFDRTAAFVRQLREHSKLLNVKREDEKKEFLEAGRTVDGFFKSLAVQLETAASLMEQRIRKFLQAKEAAERAAREAEAKRQREEAERLAAEARAREAELEAQAMAMAAPGGDSEQAERALEAAIAAEDESKRQAEIAREAQQAAEASVADLARTRSAIAGTATLATALDFEVTNHVAAVRHLARYVDADSLIKAVRAFAREYKGDKKATLVNEQPVVGVRFFLKQSARVL